MHGEENYQSRCFEPEQTMFLYVVAVLCEMDVGHTEYFRK